MALVDQRTDGAPILRRRSLALGGDGLESKWPPTGRRACDQYTEGPFKDLAQRHPVMGRILFGFAKQPIGDFDGGLHLFLVYQFYGSSYMVIWNVATPFHKSGCVIFTGPPGVDTLKPTQENTG